MLGRAPTASRLWSQGTGRKSGVRGHGNQDDSSVPGVKGTGAGLQEHRSCPLSNPFLSQSPIMLPYIKIPLLLPTLTWPRRSLTLCYPSKAFGLSPKPLSVTGSLFKPHSPCQAFCTQNFVSTPPQHTRLFWNVNLIIQAQTLRLQGQCHTGSERQSCRRRSHYVIHPYLHTCPIPEICWWEEHHSFTALGQGAPEWRPVVKLLLNLQNPFQMALPLRGFSYSINSHNRLPASHSCCILQKSCLLPFASD